MDTHEITDDIIRIATSYSMTDEVKSKALDTYAHIVSKIKPASFSPPAWIVEPTDTPLVPYTTTRQTDWDGKLY